MVRAGEREGKGVKKRERETKVHSRGREGDHLEEPSCNNLPTYMHSYEWYTLGLPVTSQMKTYSILSTV